MVTLHTKLTEVNHAEIEAKLRALHAKAASWLEVHGIPIGMRRIAASIDLAYQGQNYELPLPLSGGGDGALPHLPSVEIIRRDFINLHERTYGYSSADDPIVVVNCRLKATGARIENRAVPIHKTAQRNAIGLERRSVWFSDDKPLAAQILRRENLAAGTVVEGPAVIEQFDSTLLLFPGDRASVLEDLTLSIMVAL